MLYLPKLLILMLQLLLLDPVAFHFSHGTFVIEVCCQGLAGPWYARRERVAVKARVQWVNGSVIQMRARAQTRQRMRGNNGLQAVDEDKTEVQLQLLPDTYS